MYEVARSTDGLDRMPEDSLDDVERKQKTWKASLHDENYRREKLRADLFVGAFFAEKTKASSQTVPYTEDLVRLDSGDHQRIGVEETVDNSWPNNTWILPLALGLCRYHARRRLRCCTRQSSLGGFPTFRGRSILQFARQTLPILSGSANAKQSHSPTQKKPTRYNLASSINWINVSTMQEMTFCRNSGRYPSDDIMAKLNSYCPVRRNISTTYCHPREKHWPYRSDKYCYG